jgi:hypothetical protein
MFKAPVKIDGQLTEPEIIQRGPQVVVAQRKKMDVMLLLPAFGLLFCGVVGALVNGGFLYQMLFDKESNREWLNNQIIAMKKAGFGLPDANEKPGENKQDEQYAEQLVRLYRWVLPLSLAVSLVVFLGGVSIALRWNFRLAQLGCLLAMINISHGCCIPGAVAGLWGILMLNSEEGRGHFGR